MNASNRMHHDQTSEVMKSNDLLKVDRLNRVKEEKNQPKRYQQTQ